MDVLFSWLRSETSQFQGLVGSMMGVTSQCGILSTNLTGAGQLNLVRLYGPSPSRGEVGSFCNGPVRELCVSMALSAAAVGSRFIAPRTN